MQRKGKSAIVTSPTPKGICNYCHQLENKHSCSSLKILIISLFQALQCGTLDYDTYPTIKVSQVLSTSYFPESSNYSLHCCSSSIHTATTIAFLHISMCISSRGRWFGWRFRSKWDELSFDLAQRKTSLRRYETITITAQCNSVFCHSGYMPRVSPNKALFMCIFVLTIWKRNNAEVRNSFEQTGIKSKSVV